MFKALIGFHHGLYCHVCATWQQRRVSRQAVVKVCEGFALFKEVIMPEDSNARNKWVFAEIDEVTHRLLCDHATVLGVHPKRLIADFIGEGLAKKKDETESVDLRAYALDWETRRSEQTRTTVYQIAQRVASSGDQEHYDKLVKLCEQAGTTIDEAMKGVSYFKHPLVTSYDDGRGVASAMIWLSEKFKIQSEYPSNTIVEMAYNKGFSKNVLNAAKRRMGLISVRRPTYWAWKQDGREEEGT